MSTYTNEIEKKDDEAADALMTTHFKKILKPGATVVDVGANAGQFAEFVTRAQPEVRIFALEPQQAPFEALTRLAQSPRERHGLSPAGMRSAQPAGRPLSTSTSAMWGQACSNPFRDSRQNG